MYLEQDTVRFIQLSEQCISAKTSHRGVDAGCVEVLLKRNMGMLMKRKNRVLSRIGKKAQTKVWPA